MNRTVVVNSLSGPGAGKSTLSYGLIALLKARGHRAELVQEYAKELTYRHDYQTLSNQDLVTREQDRRIRDLIGHLDFVVQDTALPMGILYAKEPYSGEWFTRRVWELYEGYNNFNIFVTRVKPYQKYGRVQSEEESRELDKKIFDLFGEDRIDLIVEGKEGAAETAYEALMKRYTSLAQR